MQTIVLKPLHHRGQEVIGIYYNHDAALNSEVRKLPLVKWSQTNKCWYLPLSRQHYTTLKNAVSKNPVLTIHYCETTWNKRKP